MALNKYTGGDIQPNALCKCEHPFIKHHGECLATDKSGKFCRCMGFVLAVPEATKKGVKR